MTARPQGIGFELGGNAAWLSNRYKLLVKVGARGNDAGQLFDIIADPGEKNDLAGGNPQVVREMRAALEEWRASCKASLAGQDYR